MTVQKGFAVGCVLAAVVSLGACAEQGYSVIAATGTTIGLSVGSAPTGTGVETVLAYKRTEFAFVPTNRNSGEDAGTNGGGAKDSANVLMELRYGGTGSSSIYQRMAVGNIAVKQPGASLMFARDGEGKIDKETQAALENVLAISANSDEEFPD